MKKKFLLVFYFLVFFIYSSACLASSCQYNSMDYFVITKGYGIKYHVIDEYDNLDCKIWAISQDFETGKPHDLDFVFTLIKEGEDGGYFSASSLGGQISKLVDNNKLTCFYAGFPVGNQANFFFNFSLPYYFNDSDEWFFGSSRFQVEHIGSCEINDHFFSDCIKVTVNNLQEESDYLKGSGYFLLARGIGIVKLFFERQNGKKVVFEYLEHKQFKKHIISGKVVDDNKNPVQGIVVQISNADWGTRYITDSSGNFLIQAYGPDIVLRVGYDKDRDGIFDYFQPPNYIEFPVHNITSNIFDITITFNGDGVRDMAADVKVNGSDGPLTLFPNDHLRITVSLDPPDQPGTGDYFLWARIPGGACYCYAYPGFWKPCSCTDPTPTYQGTLYLLTDFEVFYSSCFGLPVGDYTLYFAVDAQMNSLLDEDAARDEVQFSISPDLSLTSSNERRRTLAPL